MSAKPSAKISKTTVTFDIKASCELGHSWTTTACKESLVSTRHRPKTTRLTVTQPACSDCGRLWTSYKQTIHG